MRKLFSLFMAAIMLMSLAPLALAREITPASTISKIEIENADITPVVGKTPADMGYGNMYADGSSSIISNTDGWWYCDSTMHSLEEDETFEVGKRYSYCWQFELNSGYTVSYLTYVTINGSRSNVDEQSTDLEDGFIWSNSVYCEEQSGSVINLVEITGVTLTPPAGGKAGDYLDFEVDNELPVLTDDEYWWCETKHTRLSDDSFFEEGFSYSLRINLEPMPGYTFSNETEVYINGSKDNVYDTNLYEGILYISSTTYYCGTPSEPIIVDEVELSDVTTAPPVGGKVYDFRNVTVPDGAHYEVVSAIWCYASDGMELDMNYEFEADKEYCLHIVLFTEYGYNFREDTKIFINGRDDLYQSSHTNVQPNILNICTVAAEGVDASGSVTGVQLDKTEATMKVFETLTLNATVLPEDATDKSVIWTSTNPAVATVENGVVTALKEGETTISVVTLDGYFTAECIITVIKGDAVIGDLNGDGKVNTADAVVVLKISAGMVALDEKYQAAGDTNRDGKVNTADAVLILKYAAGMISEF